MVAFKILQNSRPIRLAVALLLLLRKTKTVYWLKYSNILSKKISFDNFSQTVDIKNLNPFKPGGCELTLTSIVYFLEKLDQF